MPKKTIKAEGFSKHNFYIGLDVHKRSWRVTILNDKLKLNEFTQEPSAIKLANYLHQNFPGGNYYSAYEAGFCGYSIHRELLELGINNIVVNPADIPRMNKEKLSKTDKSDSRIIARELRNKELKGIYIFDPEHEEFRALFRLRLTIAKDLRRGGARIKAFLDYRSVNTPEEFDNSNWSWNYIAWLDKLKFANPDSRYILTQLLGNYIYLREKKLNIESQLRKQARTLDPLLFKLLQTIPGIGPVTAIAIMAEIGTIARFRHIKNFCSYVGLIPRVSQSGESEYTGNITYRHNSYLRPLIVEAAFQAVRYDPVMQQYYANSCKSTFKKKAIIKVARKLLSRIMYVMNNRTPYLINVS